MISSIKLIRNIGRFDSFTGGENHPFEVLTLIYAENGRGKTTLSAILRSLATGDPLPINERRRLGAQHSPHVIVSSAGGLPDAMFQNGVWNHTLQNITIFDDVFVDENVYSGLVVGSDHRQHLHELILGAQGVALNQQLQTYIARVEQHNGELRQRSAAIPTAVRGSLSVDQFCNLAANPNIDQEILSVEQRLAASRQQDPIRNTPGLQSLHLPEIDLQRIETVLVSGVADLDSTAVELVQGHLQRIGEGSERWIGDGMERQNAVAEEGDSSCVFCGQDISGSPVIAHYRAFFSEAYRAHQEAIRNIDSSFRQTHSDSAALPFERSVSSLSQCRRFWSEFGDIPELTIDSVAIIADWNLARRMINALFEQKKAAPLDPISISEDVRIAVQAFNERRNEVIALNQQIDVANQTITSIKQQAAAANPQVLSRTLTLFKATKARHTHDIDALCQAYLAEKRAKGVTEQQRDQARQAVDQYRTQVFPLYEGAINRYLVRFNAGFRLERVQAVNTRGGPACTYSVVVNNTAVSVGGGSVQPGEHSFRNILSAGDRNTLAVAFFLASIELDQNRASRVVVIDDPVSSLDDHRSLTTVQEVRRLLNQVGQLVILSHSKPFLCQVWESVSVTQKTALEVVRQGTASTINSWNVNAALETDNDRRRELLRNYLLTGTQNERDVASSIRPTLEAFFRVAYPEFFPPGALLGRFRNICSQQVGTQQEILTQADVDDLRDIVDYANLFHHDTNPAWQTAVINSIQLEGFVRRTLDFAKRP